MSIKRHNARRDANEPLLVELAEKLGAKVWRLDTPCDLLVLHRGKWLAVEVKTAKGRLTDDQEQFVADADAHGGDVLVWKSIQDVADALGADFGSREG